MKKRQRYYKDGELFAECSCCWIILPSSAFGKYSRNKLWIKETCKNCRKKRYEENKEEVLSKRKAFYQNNKEKKIKYQKEYYYQNAERVKEQHKEYRNANAEKIKDMHIKYRLKNIEEINKRNGKYIKEKTELLWYSWSKFHDKARYYVNYYELKPQECFICWENKKLSLHHPSYDSFDCRKNVVFLCDSCHRSVHSWWISCPEPVDLIQLNAHMPKILTDKDLECLIKKTKKSQTTKNESEVA